MTAVGTRIQQKRTAGWRMPANTRSVARPGPYGNPFTIDQAVKEGHNRDDAPAVVVDAFRAWVRDGSQAWPIENSASKRTRLLEGLPKLRGLDLACWCKDGAPCHVQVILDVLAEYERTGKWPT